MEFKYWMESLKRGKLDTLDYLYIILVCMLVYWFF